MSLPKSIKILLLCLPLVAGCQSTERVNQVDQFAQAGMAFADTLPAVVDESFALSVQQDSRQLIETRANLGQSSRLDAIDASNELLGERLGILRDFVRHARVLEAYFQSLQLLAQSDAPSRLGAATDGLVDRLGHLNQSIKTKLAETAIGGRSLAEFLPAAVELTVASLRAQALEAELQRNGEAIERELALTQAFLAMLEEIAQGEFDALRAVADRDEIVLPYAREGALPGDWASRREDAFRARLAFPALAQAAEAAESLRLGFIALAEGRLSPAALGTLVDDVSALVALFEPPEAEPT